MKASWIALAAIASIAAACGSVPDITFVDLTSDGGSDAGSDAASDAESDGTGSDVIPPQDGPSGCPTSPPIGYDGCCGASPCRGSTCATTACGACGGQCTKGGDVCCARSANPMCKPAVSCN